MSSGSCHTQSCNRLFCIFCCVCACVQQFLQILNTKNLATVGMLGAPCTFSSRVPCSQQAHLHCGYCVHIHASLRESGYQSNGRHVHVHVLSMLMLRGPLMHWPSADPPGRVAASCTGILARLCKAWGIMGASMDRHGSILSNECKFGQAKES